MLLTITILLASNSITYAQENNTSTISLPYDDVTDNFLTQNFSVLPKSSSIGINVVYQTTLNPGYMVSTSFVPNATGLYYFETLRDNSSSLVDTYMRIKDNNNKIIASDDDSGSNLYSAIGIKLQSGIPVTLQIYLQNATSPGSFYFQVRRQKANIFTAEYSDIDTTPDATAPKLYCEKMGYLSNSYINDTEPFAADVCKIYPKFNSEILFFSGHGNKGQLYFCQTPGQLAVLNSNNLGSMKNVKLSVWAACYSGTSSDQLTSIAQAAYQNGAKVSIGWKDVTYVSSSKKFSDKFFEILSAGYSVKVAMATALAQFSLPYENLEKYTIWGNPDTVIASSSINPKSSNVVSKQELDDFTTQLSNYTYHKEIITDGLERYYKVFDGFLSSDFFDIYKDNNDNIIKIEKSSDNFSNTQVEDVLANIDKTNILKLTVPQNNTKAELLRECDFITTISEDLTPIHIQYYKVKSEKGYEYLDITCRNLLDGSTIDYDRINTIE